MAEEPLTEAAKENVLRPRRRGPSLGAVAILVVGVLVVVGAMYYAPEITGVAKLRPWAKGSLVKHVESFVAGLQASDLTAVGVCVDPHVFLLHEDQEGRLTHLQPKAFDPRPGPVIPVGDLVPEEPVSQAEYEFEPAATVPRVVVTYPAPSNRKVVLVVQPTEHGWVIRDLMLVGREDQRGREYAV